MGFYKKKITLIGLNESPFNEIQDILKTSSQANSHKIFLQILQQIPKGISYMKITNSCIVMLISILFVFRDLKDFDLSDITDEGNGVVVRVLKDLSKVMVLDDFLVFIFKQGSLGVVQLRFCKYNI